MFGLNDEEELPEEPPELLPICRGLLAPPAALWDWDICWFIALGSKDEELEEEPPLDPLDPLGEPLALWDCEIGLFRELGSNDEEVALPPPELLCEFCCIIWLFNAFGSKPPEPPLCII